MIPKNETNNRKKEAKKYIDAVIDQMSYASEDLQKLIRKYIAQIINCSMQYTGLGKGFHFSANPGLETEINKILDSLRADIFNSIYQRAEHVNALAFEKEGKEKDHHYLLLFLSSEIAHKTLHMRIEQYVAMMRSEIEAFVAAGITNGLSANQILINYINSLKTPYTAPLLTQAFKEAANYKARRITSKGITFGRGKYTSAYNNLLRLEQETIFQTYNYVLNSLWLTNNTIIGWYTIRGSNYPCTTCDDNIGIYHPKEEFFYGYHPRCCCIMLPVFITDI